MDKPFTIALRDTEKEIIDVLNSSGLPADVVVMVLNSITEMAARQAREQYKKDLEQYGKEAGNGNQTMDNQSADADD